MDHRHICTAAMIAHHGLRTAHEAAGRLTGNDDDIDTKTRLLSMRQILFRQIILEIANVADVAGMARALYKEHPDLGAMHAGLAKRFDFLKYIRNKYVGHIVPELTSKTFEWLPQANRALGKTDASHELVLSWFVLETVINTYADATGHKVFESETDLNYPPDRTRFLNLLGRTADETLRYSALLIEVAAQQLDIPDIDEEWLPLAIIAGETEFKHIRKKR